jgi:hypothetical protein
MLCDLSNVHTGYGIMPRVTHTTDNEHWGQPGSSKKVFVSKSLTQKGGFASVDHVLERVENQYWMIRVDDFQSWMLGFYQFIGKWETTEIDHNQILVEYTYWLYAEVLLLLPFQWLFANIFWPCYMKRVLENVRVMTIREEDYWYD